METLFGRIDHSHWQPQEYARGPFDGLQGGALAALMCAAIVTELVRYPQFDAVRFFLAGGDLEELRAMEPRLVDWAQRQGCARVEIGGRAGWLRALSGYAALCTVMAKPITPTTRILP